MKNRCILHGRVFVMCNIFFQVTLASSPLTTAQDTSFSKQKQDAASEYKLKLCLFVDLFISHFGFEEKTRALAVRVPGHCLPFSSIYLPVY